MHAYSFDVNTKMSGKHYQIILTHEKKFTKEEFNQIIEEVREEIISKHPDRLFHITGQKKIEVKLKEIIQEMIKSLKFQILNLDLVCNAEEIDLKGSVNLYHLKIKESTENVSQYSL